MKAKAPWGPDAYVEVHPSDCQCHTCTTTHKERLTNRLVDIVVALLIMFLLIWGAGGL